MGGSLESALCGARWASLWWLLCLGPTNHVAWLDSWLWPPAWPLGKWEVFCFIKASIWAANVSIICLFSILIMEICSDRCVFRGHYHCIQVGDFFVIFCPLEGDNFMANFGTFFFWLATILILEIMSSRDSSSATVWFHFGVGVMLVDQ